MDQTVDNFEVYLKVKTISMQSHAFHFQYQDIENDLENLLKYSSVSVLSSLFTFGENFYLSVFNKKPDLYTRATISDWHIVCIYNLLALDNIEPMLFLYRIIEINSIDFIMLTPCLSKLNKDTIIKSLKKKSSLFINLSPYSTELIDKSIIGSQIRKISSTFDYLNLTPTNSNEKVFLKGLNRF